jgi:hypothetical protein
MVPVVVKKERKQKKRMLVVTIPWITWVLVLMGWMLLAVARYWIAPLLQWRMLNAMVGRMVVMVVMVVMVGPVEIVIAPTVITISMVTMAMVTATMTMSTTIVIAMAVSTNLHCRIVRRANSCHHSDRL